MKKVIYLLLVLVMGTAAIAGCFGTDEENAEELLITMNGVEYEVKDIFDDFEIIAVTDSSENEYEGVSLKDLLEDAGVSDLSGHTYRITASDGWMKEVTHQDIEGGILVEEGTMSVFPDLPGKYRIRDVVSIEPIDGDTIVINEELFTWMQPFDIFTERIMFDNESNEYSGVLLSDLMNATALDNPQNHNFSLVAKDGYSKELSWSDMLSGILVNDDEHMSLFPHLEKEFWVKDIVRIEVV